MSKNPVDYLTGMTLDNGWTVGKMIKPTLHSTGGHFSVGYAVENSSGKKAFLKAMDFIGAAQFPDPLKELQYMLEAYNFEKDILAKCSKKNLKRVVLPIDSGNINIKGFGIYSTVHYFIFNLAEGDVRNYIANLQSLDLAWCLRSLHNIAVGMSQLHNYEIAHQDLKPSNVLYFKKEGSKIADLGRASDKNTSSPFDTCVIAGDTSYAAPELTYKKSGGSSFEDRMLADIFLLGSLIFFYFSGVSSKHAIISKIRAGSHHKVAEKNFNEDLPHLQNAFNEALQDLKVDVLSVAGDLTDDIVYLAKQLCEPDPSLRGDHKWKDSLVPNYNLERVISKLNLLSKKAEYALK